jgi:hypothetical protein
MLTSSAQTPLLRDYSTMPPLMSPKTLLQAQMPLQARTHSTFEPSSCGNCSSPLHQSVSLDSTQQEAMDEQGPVLLTPKWQEQVPSERVLLLAAADSASSAGQSIALHFYSLSCRSTLLGSLHRYARSVSPRTIRDHPHFVVQCCNLRAERAVVTREFRSVGSSERMTIA